MYNTSLFNFQIWFAITTWAYGENDGPGIEHENKPITLILEYITYVLQEPVEESNLLVNRYLLLIIFPPKKLAFYWY